VIPVAGSKVSDAAITAPSGYSNHYTINQTDSASITVAGATLEKTTAGAENPASWTNWATGNWYAITIAVRPASTGGWSNIAKINNITSASVAKIQNIAVASIAKVNNIAV
jgi:hypothetical protein